MAGTSTVRNLSISRSRLRRERSPKPGTFGELLRTEREIAGLSQHEIARRCEIDFSHASRLESNQRAPSRELARLLADKLGLRRGPRLRFLAAADCSPFDEVPDVELAREIVSVIEAADPRAGAP